MVGIGVSAAPAGKSTGCMGCTSTGVVGDRAGTGMIAEVVAAAIVSLSSARICSVPGCFCAVVRGGVEEASVSPVVTFGT